MPPLSSEEIASFTTSHLIKTLESTRITLDVWAEDQKEHADAAAAAHEHRITSLQSQVDGQISELLAVELERGLNVSSSKDGGNAKRRAQLQREQEDLQKEIDALQTVAAKREQEIQDLKKQEAKERAKADEAMGMKQRVEEAKQTTVDDLTRGIVNYNFLGLDFEKAEDDRLRFTFTQLDAGDPLRTFSFVLNVNDDDTYEVEDPSPPLPLTVLVQLVQDLNETDDLSAFCRGMRNAFSDTL